VRDGQDLGVGEVLARIPQESQKTRDITGGLPRVAELFEARSPKDAGMLAEVTGTVSFGKDTKGKQRLVITDLDGNAHEFLIAKEKNVLVHDGHVVNKGEMIVDGPADPHDILRLLGIEALARYIVDEVQGLSHIGLEHPCFMAFTENVRRSLLGRSRNNVYTDYRPCTFARVLNGAGATITKAWAARACAHDQNDFLVKPQAFV
jgi:hypothetical protein